MKRLRSKSRKQDESRRKKKSREKQRRIKEGQGGKTKKERITGLFLIC